MRRSRANLAQHVAVALVLLGFGLWGLIRSTSYGAERLSDWSPWQPHPQWMCWLESVSLNLTLGGALFFAIHEGVQTGGWTTSLLILLLFFGMASASALLGPSEENRQE